MASVCYAFLQDVSVAEITSDREPPTSLSQSRWFTRGWTLQELLAPPSVQFFPKEWADPPHLEPGVASFGSKHSLCHTIASITGIPMEILDQSDPIPSASVAQRMSWASVRQTSRLEDEAYCLIGLFDVNMPLL